MKTQVVLPGNKPMVMVTNKHERIRLLNSFFAAVGVPCPIHKARVLQGVPKKHETSKTRWGLLANILEKIKGPLIKTNM